VRIRKHRHRWSRELRPWHSDRLPIEVVYCKDKRCEYSYEQLLLFDPRGYGVAA
jgi:hypothetical protein